MNVRRDGISMSMQLYDNAAVEYDEQYDKAHIAHGQTENRSPIGELVVDVWRQETAECATTMREIDKRDARNGDCQANNVHASNGNLDMFGREVLTFHRKADGDEAIDRDEDQVPCGQHDGQPVDELSVPNEANNEIDETFFRIPY